MGSLPFGNSGENNPSVAVPQKTAETLTPADKALFQKGASSTFLGDTSALTKAMADADTFRGALPQDLIDTANSAGTLAKRRQQMQAGSGLDSTFLGTPNAPGRPEADP